jgi:hypothetical protein
MTKVTIVPTLHTLHKEKEFLEIFQRYLPDLEREMVDTDRK